jgi:iron(III) transport system substrate-binding protein
MREVIVNRARIAAGLALLLMVAPVLPQTGAFTPDPVDLAAAKKEGAVTWYTSTPIATAQKIANLFQAETGIKVELFRSGGSAVHRRFLQEIDARRVVADVMTISTLLKPSAASNAWATCAGASQILGVRRTLSVVVSGGGSAPTSSA